MTDKIKRTITITAESDYEIHRLANVWGINVTKARERCYHTLPLLTLPKSAPRICP